MNESHRSLVAWQRAMDLVSAVYAETASFPPDERFGLTNQIRRCSVSIPSNIAEGKGRQTRKDYAHFLYQARGSLLELETQLEIARNLGYLPAEKFDGLYEMAAATGRVLNGLIKSLQRSPRESSPI
jgi:four helix bundle protein